METQQAKQQAKALASALKALGVADIPASTALEVVARMNGARSWQAAAAQGRSGRWNATQVCIYRAYPHADLLPLEEGQPYADCGDTLFAGMMDLAAAQPASRVLKTLERAAADIDALQARVSELCRQKAPFDLRTLGLPKRPQTTNFALRHAVLELDEDVQVWQDAGLRVETIRHELYAVIAGLYRKREGLEQDVILLDSVDGTGAVLPVLVPQGMGVLQARVTCEAVIDELRERAGDDAEDLFDYGPDELKVRLAQKGFTPLGNSYLGPTWD